MLNKQFFKPRNLAVIAAFTLMAHIVARPLFNKVGGREE